MNSATLTSCLVLAVAYSMVNVVSAAGSPNIQNPPDPVVAVADNSTVLFQCTGGGGALVWLINGETLTSPTQLGDQGITYATVQLTGNTLISTLSIRATESNNDTVVICKISGLESIPVSLTLQGILAAPSNLSIESISPHTITLVWREPFTLNLTSIGNDIMGYIITITSFNNVKTITRNATEPKYTFMMPAEEWSRPECDVFEFTVAAVNGAGVGEKSESITSSFEGPLVLESPSNTTVTKGEKLSLTCSVSCDTVIVWFINNHHIFQEDAVVQRSQCDEIGYFYTERLEVQLHFTQNLIVVSCTAVSVCPANNTQPNCTTLTCYTRNAYVNGITHEVVTEINNMTDNTGTSIPDNTGNSFANNTIHSTIACAVGGTLGGITLTVILYSITIGLCLSKHFKKKSGTPTSTDVGFRCSPTESQIEAIYDRPLTPPHLKPCPAYAVAQDIK